LMPHRLPRTLRVALFVAVTPRFGSNLAVEMIAHKSRQSMPKLHLLHLASGDHTDQM